MSELRIPQRSGLKPRTTSWAPHARLDQNAREDMSAALAARVFALPDIEERAGSPTPPSGDLNGSLHIVLPPELAEAAVAAGWAEVHPVALAGLARTNRVMLFGPRDEDEVDVLFGLVAAAVRYAGGRGVPADSADWLKHVFATESAATTSQP